MLDTQSPNGPGHAAATPEPSAGLDTAGLAAQLRQRLPGFGHVQWVDVTGSTNADLLARARAGQGPALPWLLGAWRQDSGRGRAGRQWANQAGDALMFSCAFEVPVPLDRLPSLSPVAGVVICEALQQQAGGQATRLGMKWPNDIQLDHAKLAGVLVETVRNPATGLPLVVIGQGINLRNGPALGQALGRAIADWSQLGARQDAADLVTAVATALEQGVALFATQGYGPFRTRHAAVDALRDSAVNVIEDGRVVMEGVARGTDESGRLLVETAQGIRPVLVGEISVRPA